MNNKHWTMNRCYRLVFKVDCTVALWFSNHLVFFMGGKGAEDGCTAES
jgi:hypothetical protein